MTTTEGSSSVSLHNRLQRRCASRWLVLGVFFAGLWIYVWRVIDPRLIYDAFGIYLPYPEFSLDETCFQEAWVRAGGPVEYLAAFVSQGFFVPALGALGVVALAALLSFGTNRLMRDLGGMQGNLVSLVPALGVLALYRTYHHPLDSLVALATSLGLAAAYQAMAAPRRTTTPRRRERSFPAIVLLKHGRRVWLTVVFLAMCAAIYYLAGTVCVIFGALVGTWLACVRRRVVVAAVAVAASVSTPWLVGVTLYSMTVIEAYDVVWPFGPGAASDMDSLPLMVLRGIFLFPLGMLWIVVLSRKLPPVVRDNFVKMTSRRGAILQGLTPLALLIAAVAAVHHFVRAPHRESRFQMVHFALERQWDEVLRAARQLPGTGHDCFSRHLVNRALYHAGRLGDEMFAFSQDPAGLLLLSGDVPHGPPKFWMVSEIAWELGDFNLAEQWAFERLEAVGECPGALELLARVCVAKDQAEQRSAGDQRSSSPGREAARMLLRRMTKNVVYGRRANSLLDALDGPPLAGNFWQLDASRAPPRREDRVYQSYSEEFMLENLLRANPLDRMAFEYLMAFSLLHRRTDKLVQNLARLDDLGYRHLPRHYEEAILIHANATLEDIPLHGRKISPETIERFHRFVDRFRQWRNDPHRAAAALAEEFGDTYFYYHAFGVSGVGRAR